MTDDRSHPDVTRRSLLKTTAGSLGVATIGQADAHTSDSERRDALSSEKLPEKLRNEAAEWASQTLWTATGTATEFPGQVVFPEYSHLAITAIPADRRGAIAGRASARAVTRLQDGEAGGFFRQQGDFLGPWTTATYHAVSLARLFDISIDESAATGFLLDHQNDAGGFAPRSGFLGGNTIPTQEATYKATVALQRLDALTQATRDRVVEFVRSTQRKDGGWAPTPRANTSTLTGTYYAIALLLSLDALRAETARNASAYLRTLEQPTGGFNGKATGNGEVRPQSPANSLPRRKHRPRATTRTTAQALLTLSTIKDYESQLNPLPPDLIGRHTDWLAQRQLHQPTDDRLAGGFETYRDGTAAVSNYLLNTVFALDALSALDALDQIDLASAIAFLAACQHPGSNGFAPWPSSLSALVDTEAAVRALALLGAGDSVPRSNLASTLASQQRSNGAITQLDWDGEPTVEQTAQAILALNRVDRLDALDRTAAATFITNHQHSSGGFVNTSASMATREDSNPGNSPSVRITWLAVRTLAAMNALSRIDRSEVADYLARLQGTKGNISSEQHDTLTAVRDTRYAIAVLAPLDRLSAVDIESVVSYLAARQNDSGTYASKREAVYVTIGLHMSDALSEIDQASTRQYLRTHQASDGGFAKKGFYSGDTAMQRHAGAIEALSALGVL